MKREVHMMLLAVVEANIKAKIKREGGEFEKEMTEDVIYHLLNVHDVNMDRLAESISEAIDEYTDAIMPTA